MRAINIQEVKRNLSKLLAEAVRGQPFVITVNGVAKVQVVALEVLDEAKEIPSTQPHSSD